MKDANRLLLVGMWLLSTGVSATPGLAAELMVDLRTGAGQPVRDAVVTVYPMTGSLPPASSRITGPFQMTQAQIQFHPFVLLAPAGATVVFSNFDKVRHHVYSFSPTKRFELKLFGREETRAVVFDKPGVVALGCNIHDRMVAYVDVVDTPYAAKSDDKGHIELKNLPEGPVTPKVWHPFLKAVAQSTSRPATLKGATHESFTLDLREPPMNMTGMSGP